MPYISAIRDKDEVRVWERHNAGERSVVTYPAPYYFFTAHEDGEYTSLFGQTLMRHDFDTYQEMGRARQECQSDRIEMFESDIPPELKVLSEHYYNKPAPTLNVTLLDIEVDYNREIGFSSVSNPYAPINSIAMYHTWEKRMIAYAIPPFDTPDEQKFIEQMNAIEPLPDDIDIEVHFCTDERELLLYVLAEIEDSDLLSGWNCIPVTQSVWGRDQILPISDVPSNLYDSTLTNIFPRSHKEQWDITLANGATISSSAEHKFPVLTHESEKYTNLQTKNIRHEELTTQEISNRSDTVFVEVALRNNTSMDNLKYTNEQLYLAGLIYTDGTLKDNTNEGSGFTVYQSDKEFLQNLPLVETTILGPWKNNYARGIKRSLLGDAYRLIYNLERKKRLNVPELSTLSYNQFMYFLSGLLDGDGYIASGNIEWCNFNDDVEALYELCLWNGIFSTVRSNALRFVHIKYEDLKLLKTSRWEAFNASTCMRSSKQKAKDTKFKIIDGNKCYVRVANVHNTNKVVEMIDIETSTHFFYTKGAKTHNCDFFDVPYIGKRVLEILGPRYFKQLSFPLAGAPRWRTVERFNVEQEVLDLQGRLTTDYLDLFRKYEVAERPSYKLESIADEVLPDLPKLEYEGSLADLYRKDFAYFVRYNFRDTEILKGFEDTLGYIALANQMYHISSGLCKHVTGTLKLAELAINNYCIHELNIRVPDNDIDDDSHGIQGAYVLEPKVGMHEWIGSIDIKSLYPSSIRSINISPETLVGQFRECERAVEEIKKESMVTLTLMIDGNSEPTSTTAEEWRKVLKDNNWAISGFGTVFDQTKQGVIPAILETWYGTRLTQQQLMRDASTPADRAYYDRLQYVYKIKLNSLYGALNNRFFRYYDLRMGESTTGTGRMILKHMCSTVGELLDGQYALDSPSVIYGDSVSGDTKIYTNKGTFNIEDLFIKPNRSNEIGKEYCDIHNLKTLTFNPDTGDNEFRKLKYVMRHRVDKDMYRVWFGNTRYVDVTEDHSLIGYANTRHKTPGLVEVKPTDIGKNNVNGILLNRHIPRTTVHRHGDDNAPIELFVLMGLIVGDGHVERKIESGVGLSLGNSDKQEIIEKVLLPLKEQGWLTSIVHMKNGHDVRLCGTKLWYFLQGNLYPNGKKIIPEWLYDCTEENICAFLRGYFTADGFANKNKTVGLCSINLEYIIQANNLLKLCGIPSNYWTETTENSYKGKKSGTYTVRLTVYDAVDFGKKIGFVLDRKNKNVRTQYSKQTKHLTTQTGYCVVHPTKIEKIQTPEYVYDIEVDGTHTFYANDILVHNTDSVYFNTHAKNREEAVLIADTVAEQTTASFQKFMQETFLCSSGYDNIIQADREVVANRGIFVDKKRYVLNVVNKEGKDLKDGKLKVMGLDTKKTTLPADVSKQLNAFVERLLKGEDWKTIADDIVDYKEELRTTPDVMTIGLPKGVKKVEEYTYEYKIHGDGVRLPGHVAASIFYNQCLKEYDDRDNLPIVSGMKIKVFYLTQKYGRFKNIAIPTDTAKVPDWFLNNFSINRDMHIERLVDNPLNNIIKAIGKETPSKQSMMVDELLDF